MVDASPEFAIGATTSIYIRADLAIKQQAIAKTAPPSTAASATRYLPEDTLMVFPTGSDYADNNSPDTVTDSVRRSIIGVTTSTA